MTTYGVVTGRYSGPRQAVTSYSPAGSRRTSPDARYTWSWKNMSGASRSPRDGWTRPVPSRTVRAAMQLEPSLSRTSSTTSWAGAASAASSSRVDPVVATRRSWVRSQLSPLRSPGSSGSPARLIVTGTGRAPASRTSMLSTKNSSPRPVSAPEPSNRSSYHQSSRIVDACSTRSGR